MASPPAAGFEGSQTVVGTLGGGLVALAFFYLHENIHCHLFVDHSSALVMELTIYILPSNS